MASGQPAAPAPPSAGEGSTQVVKDAALYRQVPLDQLRVTQLSVGELEVKDKVKALKKKQKDGKLKEFLAGHVIPYISGPGGAIYIIDHHHLARALFELPPNNDGSPKMCVVGPVEGAKDYSNSLDTEAEFYKDLADNDYAWPYDADCQPVPKDDLATYMPKGVADLKNNPWRSLAYLVRTNGGYDKTKKAFAEFKWARFFRHYPGLENITDNVEDYTDEAVKAAHSREAELLAAMFPDDLPGYNGKRHKHAD